MKFENKLFVLVMILHVSTFALALFQLRAAMYISLAAFIITMLGWNYSAALEQRRREVCQKCGGEGYIFNGYDDCSCCECQERT